MKREFLFLVVMGFSLTIHAQATIDSVKATVNNMFIAMKTADSALMVASFTDSAILQSIEKNKAGKIRIKSDVVKVFASFLNTQEKGALDEQIVFDVVKVDGDLATVWTPYKFYFKGKFSHCGVNSFQLVRINNIWKIQYLIDTKRTKGCD